MALGAVSIIKQGVYGNTKYVFLNVIGSASYTTTGDALPLPAICGMPNTILYVDVDLLTPSPGVTFPVGSYDYVNQKLQVFGTAAGASGLTESTAATNFSTFTFRLQIFGI